MSGVTVTWLDVASRREVLLRCAKVGLCVGTVLMLINHGDHLMAGEVEGLVLAKILISYFVPFSVSLWSSIQTVLAAQSSILFSR